MTPTLAGMKELERMLKEANMKPKTKTMIGGGSTSQEFATQIGADAWGPDAITAVDIAAKLAKK
jgi:methanogenic corrinoid protein MtbC1